MPFNKARPIVHIAVSNAARFIFLDWACDPLAAGLLSEAAALSITDRLRSVQVQIHRFFFTFSRASIF